MVTLPEEAPDLRRRGAGVSWYQKKRSWYQKKRWWAAGALALIIVVGGMSGGGETTDDQELAASDANPQSEPNEQPADETAAEEEKAEEEAKVEEPAEPKAVKVPAKQILKDFEENEAAADVKYAGKVLEVSGTIDKIDTDIWNDEKYIVRVGSADPWAFLSVNCNGLPASAVTRLKKGSDVTVRGEFDDGGDLGVEIEDCKVL